MSAWFTGKLGAARMLSSRHLHAYNSCLFTCTLRVQDVTAVTDNAAVLQQRVTKGTNPFLSTLAEPGEAQFLTVLKPCSILLPHTHQRANEFYSVIFGTRLLDS